uniref:Ubiquitin-like domain-containing protein n=1 Tax=Arion vulgaris TaxID=1028688 RepID=A0A0B6ZW32_9EUPU
MQITITTLSDQLFNVDISEDLELENFKVLCEIETSVPASEMLVVWNGRPLHDDKLTLKQYGIKNGEIVLVQHLRGQITAGGSFQGLSSFSQTQPEDDPSFIRDLFLKNPSHLAMLKTMNPPLADALLSGDIEKFNKVYREQRQLRIQHEQDKLRLVAADPFNPNSQELIEEAISFFNICSSHNWTNPGLQF